MSSFYKKMVVEHLRRGDEGSFTLIDQGECVVESFDPSSDLVGKMVVRDQTVYREMVLCNDVGLADSYVEGKWDSEDLTSSLRWLLRNRKRIASNRVKILDIPVKVALRLARNFRHLDRRNSKSNSRRNIHEHYDLGNEFFREFLDESMTYSSAFFTRDDQSLEDAQFEKYDRICQKLSLSSSDRLLEIGCGWGGFAIHAAVNYGCKVTATTISKEQFDEAKRRVKSKGMEERIDITLTDYRDLEGNFDKIASIEMLEAVGHEYLGTYFSQVDRLLNKHGVVCVQVITCPGPLYGNYKKNADFIQSRIFPGSHLPSNHALIEASEKGGGLEALNLESFGIHYAETLRRWLARFEENWNRIKPMGFDQEFYRKWKFYLCYCEAGFLERHVNVSQITFARPDELGFEYERQELMEAKSLNKASSGYLVAQ